MEAETSVLVPEKFYFGQLFLWVVCFVVIRAFSQRLPPQLTLTALIFIITSSICAHTHTRSKPTKHSSLPHRKVTTKGAEGRLHETHFT